jgi:hypothetical protein
MTLNLGLSQKIGLPDYGSLGCSCNVQVELPAGLVFDDLEAFHRQVKNVYIACSQAVSDELARHQQAQSVVNNRDNTAAIDDFPRETPIALPMRGGRQNGHGSPNNRGSQDAHRGQPNSGVQPNGHSQQPNGNDHRRGNCQHNGVGPHNGNGAHNVAGTHNGAGCRASEKQLTYIRQLGGQIQGLGVRRLDVVTAKMFGKPLADLSSLDGSGLIDVLKDVKTGKIDLGNVLGGDNVLGGGDA